MSDKIFDPDFAEPTSRRSDEAWFEFVTVVRQLRWQCPWDREQTHRSMRHLIIEEAYEVVDAIDSGRDEELVTELGDLALQVVMQTTIADEEGRFSLSDVLRSVTEKLIRRHPHVFGEAVADDSRQVVANWEAIKAIERKGRSVLSGVPKQLPALLEAYRTQEKASGVGFDFADAADAWSKVEEEIGEFGEADNSHDREAEFGDLLFALVNFARLTGLEPENALRAASRRFRRRFSYIESQIPNLAEASMEEMDHHWEAAKREESDV
ncbi:MAG: nucleoside triphosphate pyrophosphohydrolase [Bacteroidota bacterium]|nr:nucleoside triphosphate pyrophosphohydrolase [Bacteroidota bacterium]